VYNANRLSSPKIKLVGFIIAFSDSNTYIWLSFYFF